MRTFPSIAAAILLAATSMQPASAGIDKQPVGKSAEPVGCPAADPSKATGGGKADRRISLAQTALAIRLLRATAPADGTQSGVATVAPASLAAVLSALDIGADAKLRQAIGRLLAAGGRPSSIEAWRSALRLQTLEAGRSPMRIADALFVDEKTPLKPGIADRVEAELRVPVNVVDFSKDGASNVNAFVSQATNGAIPSILDSGDNVGLVAINAFHFADCWKFAFDPADTAKAPFATLDGPVDVPMMHLQDASLAAVIKGRFAAIELPYASASYSLILVTTTDKPAPLRDFDTAQASALLAGVGLAEKSLDLALPAFQGDAAIELLPALAKLGLASGLASPTALSGFADGLALSAVHQKTMIEVSERGTEAAGATAAIATRSAGPKPLSMVFDKPFVFALRHRQSGLVALAGYYAGPTKSGAKEPTP